MAIVIAILFSVGFLGWVCAWLGCRDTTLRPAVMWAMAAWASWTALAFQQWASQDTSGIFLPYLSLGLTACAGIAVFGARRPGVMAWNFVVVGLLAVLLLPVVEGFGEPRLHTSHLLFLGVILFSCLLNYVPTRFGLAAGSCGIGCAIQLAFLGGSAAWHWMAQISLFTIGILPWLGWICWRARARAATSFDATWRSFRDRFGWLWAERMRDQFNRAAANAGWNVPPRWPGLERPADCLASEEEMIATLEALLKRFRQTAEGDNRPVEGV